MPALMAHRVAHTRPPDMSRMGAKRSLIVSLAWRKPARITMLAHDSGDGETIFHCPFCGSGQVLARSDGTVDCEFCHTAFTVQVQPEMPAFPQTINGMPFQIPGMPAGGENAMVDPASPAAQANAAPDQPPPGVDPASGEGDGPPEGDPSSDDTAEGGPPDFLKNSYRTERGTRLSAQSYMRHLALTHTTSHSRLVDTMRKELR